MEIPTTLTERDQWITWKFLDDGSKFPIGKSNDPTTWHPFSRVEHLEKIAYVFSADDPFCGIDLDDCLVDGELTEIGQEILDRFRGVAFAEFSPSGTGIKLITKAIKKKGSRCSNSKGIECYDNKRFWTITKEVVPGFEVIGDGQESVDWLIEKYLKGVQSKTTKVAMVASTTSLSTIDRARAYCDNVPFAPSGQRNNSGFSLSGHLHAIVGENGERLSDQDVLGLLREWNARNPEPLDENELNRLSVSGRLNGTPRENKEPKIVEDMDISDFMRDPTLVKKEPKPKKPDNPFPECFYDAPGIIQEFVEYSISIAPRPRPELSLAVSLAMIATITGRKVCSESGMRTNLYIVGLAPSGSGKDHPRSAAERCLNMAEMNDMVAAENPASDAALITALHEQPVSLFLIDEINKFFSSIKTAGAKAPYLAGIPDILMRVYTQCSNAGWKPKCYGESKKNKTIAYPHCCLYGTGSTLEFWKSIKSSDSEDGFLARIIVLEAPSAHPRKQKGLKYKDPPESLINRLREWNGWFGGSGNLANTIPQAQVIPFDQDARTRLDKHSDDIEDRLPTESIARRTIWSRTSATAEKLSMIFACSRGPDGLRVTIDDANRAVKFANWTTHLLLDRVFTHVSENEDEGKRKRVLELIREGDISRNELTKKTQWLRGNKEREEILKDLLAGEQIEQEWGPVLSNGKQVMWFRCT